MGAVGAGASVRIGFGVGRRMLVDPSQPAQDRRWMSFPWGLPGILLQLHGVSNRHYAQSVTESGGGLASGKGVSVTETKEETLEENLNT